MNTYKVFYKFEQYENMVSLEIKARNYDDCLVQLERALKGLGNYQIIEVKNLKLAW